VGLLAVWVYNSRVASGYEKEARKVQDRIDPLSSADSAIKKAEATEKEYASRAEVLANAIADQKYWVGMFSTLNNLLKDDQIWIVQITPYGADNKPLPGKLFDNEVDWPFDLKAPAGSSAPKDKMLITDLLVVAINRSDENSGANAIEFFKSLATNPDAQKYFDLSAKNDEERIQKYLKHEVGDLQSRYGYPFTMRLPLKRQVEVGIRSTKP
jgi:hypothetical protein